MSESFELGEVDRLTVGTVGEPGQRVFYMQARKADRLVTLKAEKQQVAALADYLDKLLADLPTVDPLPDDLELEDFVEPAWTLGPIGIAYDPDRAVVVIEAQERLTEDSRGEAAIARFLLRRDQAAALAARGAVLVTSGRPPCPHCGSPIDAEHVCPKSNGHRPPRP